MALWYSEHKRPLLVCCQVSHSLTAIATFDYVLHCANAWAVRSFGYQHPYFYRVQQQSPNQQYADHKVRHKSDLTQITQGVMMQSPHGREGLPDRLIPAKGHGSDQTVTQIPPSLFLTVLRQGASAESECVVQLVPQLVALRMLLLQEPAPRSIAACGTVISRHQLRGCGAGLGLLQGVALECMLVSAGDSSLQS
jgi:hypothetical protein